MRRVWQVVGIIILAWAAWDLYAGYTFTWRIVDRSTSPVIYWAALGAWVFLGLSCFFSRSGSPEKR